MRALAAIEVGRLSGPKKEHYQLCGRKPDKSGKEGEDTLSAHRFLDDGGPYLERRQTYELGISEMSNVKHELIIWLSSPAMHASTASTS